MRRALRAAVMLSPTAGALVAGAGYSASAVTASFARERITAVGGCRRDDVTMAACTSIS